MDKPIYRIFLNRSREAWYQLSEEERNSYNEKYDKAFQELGIKVIDFYDTSWSTEQWDFAGIVEYPNIEAVQELRRRQEEWGWFRYIDSSSVLATRIENPSM